jgi:adenylate cyclase
MPQAVPSSRSRLLHPSAWPIAAKLSLVLVVVSLIPMGVTAGLDVWQAREAAELAEHDNLRMLATSSAGRIDQLLADTQRVAAQVAGDAEVVEYLGGTEEQRAAVQESAQQTLANVTRSNADIASAFLIDASGKGTLSTRGEEIGLDVTHRAYYQEAFRTGSYVSELTAGSTSKRLGVYFSHVVKSPKRGVVGVAVLKLAGEVIAGMVEAIHPQGGGALLLDSYGVIVGDTEPSFLYKSLGRIAPEVLATPVFDQRFTAIGVDRIEDLGLHALSRVMVGATLAGSTDVVFPGGSRQLAGYAPLSVKTWTLVVHEPAAKLAEPLAQITHHAAVNGLLVGAVVALLAMALARAIVSPLRRLTEAAQAVRRGDFVAARLEPGSEDEIGVLSESFNRMAHGLEARERELEIFGRLVSPEVREELLSGHLELGGATRRAAVLFSDIRGFSTLAEKMDPQAVVALLNEYLTAMASATGTFQGYINNFIGDAIVVVFGAPIPQSDAERRAVLAALAMRDALAELNVRRTARGDAAIETGIGIAAGDMVAGQIGSPERMLYTVIGDAVNVASRLETLTKDYPGKSILLTRRVADALAADPALPHVESLGLIKLKGRTEPVEVFAVVR